MNKVILLGRLSKDINLTYTTNNLAIAKSAIATSRKYKTQVGEQKNEVCFVDITFFGKTAEIAEKYLSKGDKLLIEGRLTFNQWVDKNGQKRSNHSIAVETIEMIGSKNRADTAQQHKQQKQQKQINDIDDGDDIPF